MLFPQNFLDFFLNLNVFFNKKFFASLGEKFLSKKEFIVSRLIAVDNDL